MNRVGCPVCGYKELTALDDFNCTTFEICECCGSESGVEYDQNSSLSHLLNIRREWVLVAKCSWWGDKESMPINWHPYSQMELAGLEIPSSE